MSNPVPSGSATDVRGVTVGEPASACPVEGREVEGSMADETPWARFYRLQAGEAFSSTVGRLLECWKTRRTLGDRDVTGGEERSLRR